MLGFAEGSAEKTALHAAVGAIVAKMAGGDVGSGAFAGAVSEIANGIVQDLLKTNPNLTDAQKASLTQWAAVAVGAAVGGQLGAATALDNVNHNYLTHEQLDKFAAELKGCASEPDSAACEQRVSQRYEELDFAQERAFEACRTMACAEEHLSQMQFDQKRLYAQILAIQELGADSALGQRLLANQVDFMLDHRIVDVLAGISYCEANGGTSGCFETGQIVKFFAEGVTALAYAALGISNLNRGNGSVKPGQGETVDGNAGSLPSPPTSVDGILRPNGIFVGTVRKGATPNIRTVSASEFEALTKTLLAGAEKSTIYSGGKGIWYILPGGGRVGVRVSPVSGTTLDVDIPGYPKGFKVHQQ